MEPTPADNLRALRAMVGSAPSVAIVRVDEVRWLPGSDGEETETHARWTCMRQIAGPVPPPSIVIPSDEVDRQRVFHMLVVTAPESYLVGLDGSRLLFALEVELDDDGHYELVNRLWRVSLDQLTRPKQC